MPAVETLTVRRDHHLRRRVFDPRSFEHDARANLNLLTQLVDRYSQPGDTILDPMAGTGSLYIAAGAGHRRVICGELEAWLRPILESNRRRGPDELPLVGLTSPTHAYQGDARALPLTESSIDSIIFSPPYADTFSDWHISSNRLKTKNVGPHGSAYGDDRGRSVKRNLGNVHIYEEFLRAMRPALAECGRVLREGAPLVMIVKDKIKGGRRVPIVRDLLTLCRALGFAYETAHEWRPPLSQYRQIHKAHGLPVIEDEQVIVCRRAKAGKGGGQQWSLVMVPEAEGPPSLVYAKALAHAQAAGGTVLALLPGRRASLHRPDLLLVDRAPDPFARAKFRLREEAAHSTVEELVGEGLRAGDHVSLHVANRYAAYIEERLVTLGCTVAVPTRGLNMGQKLTYYTRRVP